MITMTEQTIGIWFMPIQPKQDWLAAATELEPGRLYQLDYRFRYHKDDKFFDSKDEKNWYTMTVHSTREHVIALIRRVANSLLGVGADGPLTEVLNEGTQEEFMEKFMHLPFVQARPATAKEIADMDKREGEERAQAN
jgi:hypothetical protein